MKQSLFSLLTLSFLTAGCTGIYVTSSDDTNGEMVETDYATAYDLYSNECSVVYSTNMFRAVSDWSDGSYSDDKGTIESGSLNLTLMNSIYQVITDEVLSLPSASYGDVIETSITFPNYTSIWDTIGARFDLYFSNLRVSYPSQMSTYRTSADDGLTRDCYYYYFITLHNRSYTGTRNTLAKVGSATSLINERPMMDDQGHTVTAAVAKFDLLKDFAESKGITATDRKAILNEMKTKKLFEAFLKYRNNIKDSANNTKVALAKGSAGLPQLAFERMKSSLGSGAPTKLLETIDAMVDYSANLK